jgi:hypothetical protein
MRTPRMVLLCMVVLTVVFAVQLSMAQSAKLEGVWKIAEVTTTGADARTITKPAPSQIMVSRKHYSMIYVSADNRPMVPQQNATDAQKVAAWTPFTANAGTYELKGTTLTLHPVVAKSPNIKPDSFSTWELKIGENTLTITQKELLGSPVQNPMTFKLVRVE